MQVDAGLEALETAMNSGFEQYSKIRSDPNLETLRTSPKFKELIDRYDEPVFNDMAVKCGPCRTKWCDVLVRSLRPHRNACDKPGRDSMIGMCTHPDRGSAWEDPGCMHGAWLLQTVSFRLQRGLGSTAACVGHPASSCATQGVQEPLQLREEGRQMTAAASAERLCALSQLLSPGPRSRVRQCVEWPWPWCARWRCSARQLAIGKHSLSIACSLGGCEL